MTLPDVPPSDELDQLLVTVSSSNCARFDLASFSDDFEAQQLLATETQHVKTAKRVVVQHRSWNTKDVFRSEPQDPSSPATMAMPFIASSPPPTPPAQTKRKLGDLDLGKNTLERPVKAQRSYYGIDIHRLLEDAQAEDSVPKHVADLPTPPSNPPLRKSSLLWTEKYRARKFTDLLGDERTHRAVMHWLKRWDTIVFPGSHRSKASSRKFGDKDGEKKHKKILLLTGPPGLGKTTLAHVCAKQAGYDVQEINASDERSSGVVKGRIRDMLGTENVKVTDAKSTGGRVEKGSKPVCVIVDEVDGVVSGSGSGGEGGFIKALIDLLVLDQKNSTPLGTLQQGPARAKKKGDRFRMLRPMVLICNDVYHPSLRPLRQSSYAEVIHVRKPPVQNLISRLRTIFDKEGVPCENDGVRRLCEATWGVSNRKEDRSGSGAAEGDMRGIMVVGEWVAGKLRASNDGMTNARLTRRWVEDNLLQDLSHGGGAARSLGRGGPKDIVERVFQEGAGFPRSSCLATPQQQTGNTGVKGVAEDVKRTAGERLRELVDTHGDTDRIMTDCFSAYPEHPFQDDTLMSKPAAAYEWLHFHDVLSSAVYGSHEWELAPYLSTPILAFHHLFASPTRAQYTSGPSDEAAPSSSEDEAHQFTGPQASWAAHETSKRNEALLQTFHATLSPSLSRAFTSPADLSTTLLPYLLRMLSPSINPVLVGGGTNGSTTTASVRKSSEQALVARAVHAMLASGVRFERTRVDPDDSVSGPPAATAAPQWVYRMEPSLDELGLFPTGGKGFGEARATRFAVRQVLEQAWVREEKVRAEAARAARVGGLVGGALAAAAALAAEGERAERVAGVRAAAAVKRDFFGRPMAVPSEDVAERDGGRKKRIAEGEQQEEGRVWVTYHEGFSNAVRKPVSLAELMRDL